MKNVFKSLEEWAAARRKSIIKKREASRRADLVRESEEKLQVREFHGELFLCYCNVPILPGDCLAAGLLTAIDVAREAYRIYEDAQRKGAT